MIKCPMCRDLLPDDARKCRKCQTDLSLLADYVTHLREGLSQAEVAALLDVSERTIKRRWQSARLRLAEALGDTMPGL